MSEGQEWERTVPCSLGLRAALAFPSGLGVREVEGVIDFVEGFWSAPLMFRTFDGRWKSFRRRETLSARLTADLLGRSSVSIEPVGDEVPFWVSVYAGEPGGRSAPMVTWDWDVRGPAGPPRLPPGVDPERWYAALRELAGLYGARMGYVHSPGAASDRVFGVNVGNFYLDQFDMLSGYRWITLLDEELVERLGEHHRIDSFPWFENISIPIPGGTRSVRWLRATEHPGEMTPELWSRLRAFFLPLLPAPVTKQADFLASAWAPFAPEDIFHVPEHLRRP